MKLLLTSVLFAFFPLLASATVITGGAITIKPFFSNNTFNFSGPGFSVSGGVDDGNWGVAFCAPCSPGSTLGVNGLVNGSDFESGNATVGATNFASIHWADDFAVRGSEFFVVGPPITLDAGAGTYHSTFSLTGSLCGTTSQESDPKACLVDLNPLTGSGVVDVTYTANPAAGALEFSSAVYTFTATPESQTWILALLGIMAILVHRRKAARRESSTGTRTA